MFRVVVRGSGDTLKQNRMLIGFRQAGVSIISVGVAKPTLDEVFLALTGHGAEDEAGLADDNDPYLATSNETADEALEVQ